MPSGAPSFDLLERADERAAVVALAERAAGGDGGVMAIVGPAGIGKTGLLAHVAPSLEAAGLRTGWARGHRLEQGFAFGAVRQMLEPFLRDGADARLLTGAAAAVTPLFDITGATTSAELPTSDALHGLYWLVAGIVEEHGPVALVGDDAQWFDSASLRFCNYLAHRIAELPVALVVAARPGDLDADADLLTRLIEDPATATVTLRPLSAAGVASLVKRRVRRADAASCDAIARASGGNPFLAEELVRSIGERDGEVDGDTVSSSLSAAVSSTVLARVGRMPADAAEVARAVAVLGPEAHLRHVADLAGLSVDDAGLVADTLVKAEVLATGRPLGFVHPVVATAVYQAMSPGDRSRRHRRAAAVLQRGGESVQHVCAHLMRAEPAGDEHVVDTLVDAARLASGRGAPDVAVELLTRAMDEPPRPERRSELLLQLGLTEFVLLRPSAAAHLDEAVGRIDDPAMRLQLALAKAMALCLAGRPTDAVGALDAVEPTTEVDGGRRDAWLAACAHIGATGPTATPLVRERIAELNATVPVDAETTPDVMAMRSFSGAVDGEPADRVAALAGRALAAMDDGPSLPIWFHQALSTLVICDRDAAAAAAVAGSLTPERRSGSAGHVGPSLFVRSWLALRAGDLDDAWHDASDLRIHCLDEHRRFLLPAAVATMVEVLRERDDLAGAERLLVGDRLDGAAGDSLFDDFLLLARVRLRAAQQRWDEALVDLELGERRAEAMGCRGPGYWNWRTNRAFLLLWSGRRSEAQDHAWHALQAASDFGAPRALAEAMRVVAWASEDDAELASGAEQIFVEQGARLEQVRTMIARAIAPPVAGSPTEAVVLGAALDIADRCGAVRLARIARQRLRTIGAVPASRPVTGVDALTAGERRVAVLASDGLTNKQIGQQLFVTVKTVETHLAHAFQKLQITSRHQLAEHLAPLQPATIGSTG